MTAICYTASCLQYVGRVYYWKLVNKTATHCLVDQEMTKTNRCYNLVLREAFADYVTLVVSEMAFGTAWRQRAALRRLLTHKQRLTNTHFKP